MSREVHVRFCERGGVQFPSATHLVILVSGTREQAEQEKAALADYLRQSTGLELSEEKTRISDLTEGIEFLGHRVRLKWHHQFGLMPRIEIPKSRRADFRYRVKQMTKRSTINRSLSHLLRKLNPILRGWGNFYRFCTGAGQLFGSLDHYVGDRLWRWLMKKHGSLHRKRSTIRRLPSLLRPSDPQGLAGGSH
jgi:RNA-directed DNA polymerase